MAIWFEQRPEPVVRDFSIFKERDEALGGWQVIAPNGIYQQVKSCEISTIGPRSDCRTGSMRFKLGKVVE